MPHRACAPLKDKTWDLGEVVLVPTLPRDLGSNSLCGRLMALMNDGRVSPRVSARVDTRTDALG